MNTLLDPKLQQEARLEAYRNAIIIYLNENIAIYDEDEVKEKLKKICNESKLLELQKHSFFSTSIESFMKYI
ncbi:hypothetical protein WKH56_10385 [Priestia sp. SB1]|uniref:Uncharacterized protein n=1 Tax=Priestia aryabhattai TaxID=412384 RepID=A0AAX6NDA1_PRIAR|nr:hypothetical protein [Priestia aryabhattai]MDU9693640.1 hypothetical protein [Priestia aryabhattai]NGY89139.1 hypothetical protein [Priestia megaterium]